MRKLLILCLVSVSTLVYSQKEIAWFDAGLKLMYGGSSVINMAAIDASDLNYDLTFGNALGFGGKFGINKGYNGLAIELMYTKSGMTHEYLQQDFAPEIEWKSLDLYLLFRNAKNLGFFELGPKIGFLRSVERTGADGGNLASYTEFNKRQISGVLSFGVNVLGTDGAFSGQIGMRFEYGFTDLNGSDPQGDQLYPYYTDKSGSDLFANGYEKSTPVYAGLVFELNWGIGYYGIAKCGARAKFFNM